MPVADIIKLATFALTIIKELISAFQAAEAKHPKREDETDKEVLVRRALRRKVFDAAAREMGQRLTGQMPSDEAVKWMRELMVKAMQSDREGK
jgi:hypothetical protein